MEGMIILTLTLLKVASHWAIPVRANFFESFDNYKLD